MRVGVICVVWLWSILFAVSPVFAGKTKPSLPDNKTLQTWLSSPKESVQLKAVSTAHRLPAARYLALLPAMKRALKSRFLEVRISAWVFLLAKRLDSSTALQIAQKLMLHPSENVRQRAIRWLLKSGLSDKQLLSLTKRALKDQHWLVRMTTLQESKVRPALLAMLVKEVLLTLKDKEAAVRFVTSDLLAKWGHRFWTPLQAVWKTSTPSSRRLLLSALRLVVKKQPQASVLMQSGLLDKDKTVREAAALEAGRLSWPSLKLKNAALQGLLSALLKALQDKVAEVRVAAAWALGQMGKQLASSKAKPAARAVGRQVVRKVALLLRSSKSSKIKIAAADALGHFQLELQPALGVLVKALDDADWKVRRAVATTLYRGGPGLAQRVSPALIPGIIKGLFEKQSWVNRVTARILGWMGPRASAALPYLRKKLNHKDIRVRMAAKKAIQAIVLP